MSGIAALRANDVSKAPLSGSARGARKLFQNGRSAVIMAKGTFARHPLFRTPSVRERELSEEVGGLIEGFVDGNAKFAALRLAKRFGGIEFVLAASEAELASVIPDEPRLVRALSRSRYFSAFRAA